MSPGGKQIHWAQEEQGQAVLEMIHSYIYTQEVTYRNLDQQLMRREGRVIPVESVLTLSY